MASDPARLTEGMIVTIRLPALSVLAAVAAALAGGAPQPASAQVIDETVTREAFLAADTNADGVVDEAEFAADSVTAFADLDANADGVLIIEELQGATPAAFSRVDVDSDGRLTLDEVRQGRLADFARMDSSGDGVLTLDEVLKFEPAQ
jgi:hypothetical protein